MSEPVNKVGRPQSSDPRKTLRFRVLGSLADALRKEDRQWVEQALTVGLKKRGKL